ncbi:MAG: hypothetical protein QXO98_01740 [Sulfolobales archaeon]
MKVLRKVFYVDNDLIQQCSIVINDNYLEIVLKGKIPLKLIDRKTSLSLREYEIVRDARGSSLLISMDDITGLECRRVIANSELFLKLFDKYVSKNPNIYYVYLKVRFGTYKFVLAQRDMMKLRNFILESLHSNK